MAAPHLCIDTVEPVRGRRLQLTTGFIDDEPVIALFVGDDDQPILIALRDLMATLELRKEAV